MGSGPTKTTEVLVILVLLILPAPFALAPVARAQMGQWTVTTSLQASLSVGMATVMISGSGSSTLNVNGQGQISGTGSFHGIATATASTGCSGGGTFSYSESETYSGQMTNSATHNSTLYVTSSGSTAPASFTVTCPNPSPPPATTSYNYPIPSQMGTAAGTYSVLLVDGYTYKYNFPSPLTGSLTIRVSGGTTTATTTTTSATSAATTSLSTTTTTTSSSSATTTSSGIIDTRLSVMALGGRPDLVQICEPGHNNCRQANMGDILQPGYCLVTTSSATPTGIAYGLAAITTMDGKMQIMMGQNGDFCAPTNPGSLSSLYWQAYEENQIWGSLHVDETYNLGMNVRVITPVVAVTPTGTQFTIQSSTAGTTVMVISGSVLVTNLVTNSSLALHAGQMITVTNPTMGMTQQQMQQGMTSFDLGAMDQWWSPLVATNSTVSVTSASAGNTSSFAFLPSYGLIEIALVAAFAVVLVVFALVLARGRFGKSKVAQQAVIQPRPALTCPNCGAPVGSHAFCENCGTRLR